MADGKGAMKGLVVGLAALALAATSALAADAKDKTKSFGLSSTDVKDGGTFARKFAGKNPNSKNCDGDNLSPALHWTNVPDGTKSFAIVMSDPVPRGGLGFVHWVAYDIPQSQRSLKQGAASHPTEEFKGGKNGAGTESYFGPCPPIGDKAHPYVIVLIATDLVPGNLKPGLTRDELGAALQGHVKGQTSLVARYGH
jgi:Raf kinase inhibitor-like YbhB/YbcL family protein